MSDNINEFLGTEFALRISVFLFENYNLKKRKNLIRRKKDAKPTS